jgi:hypothetical protein
LEPVTPDVVVPLVGVVRDHLHAVRSVFRILIPLRLPPSRIHSGNRLSNSWQNGATRWRLAYSGDVLDPPLAHTLLQI